MSVMISCTQDCRLSTDMITNVAWAVSNKVITRGTDGRKRQMDRSEWFNRSLYQRTKEQQAVIFYSVKSS